MLNYTLNLGEFMGAILLYMGLIEEHTYIDGSESKDSVDSPRKQTIIGGWP